MTRYTKYKKRHNAPEVHQNLEPTNQHRHKVCLRCRKKGHSLAECRLNTESDLQGSICYKCGSVEHSLSECPEKGTTLAHATCFICGEQGHISKDCPKNESGVYPKGGSCHHCGSVRHFAKECPERKAGEPKKAVIKKKPDVKKSRPRIVKI